MRKILFAFAALAAFAFTACQQTGKSNSTEQPQAETDSMKSIPQTDATVLVLVAHPNIQKSNANAALAKAASEVEGVQVVNIYDYPVTPEAYKECVSRAKAIVYQFPIYWMSAPHLMKQWTDEVFMVFTQDESLVKGKRFMVCCTTGSPEAAYQHGGKNKYTIEEYLRPYEGQANHAEMIWEKPLPVYGQFPNGGQEELKQGCQKYQERLQALVEQTK